MSQFSYGEGVSIDDLRSRLADRVRYERKRQGWTQAEFAEMCNIPLRTFKRFEQGTSDSLDVFVRIVVNFERVSAFELLFPQRAIDPPNAVTKLERLIRKVALDKKTIHD